MTTEQCLLNANRNPALSREEIEHRVKELAAFGAPIDKYVPANVAKRMKVMGKRGMRTGATEAKD